MAANVEIRGLKELQSRLAPDKFQRAAKAGLAKAAVHVRERMQIYPPVRPRRQPFKSDASRRFFFAALRSGEITVPYRRSGLLGRSWLISQPAWHKAIIGNATAYARLVQSQEDQSGYHKDNWVTDEQVAKKEGGKVTDIVTAHIAKWANS